MSEIDLLIKLFDTLKDSSKETQELCRAMLTNQTRIGSTMKGIPFDEIKSMLKEHAKESSQEIDTCAETVETKSDGLMEEIKNIGHKVNRMILVVVVAFSVMTGGYFLIKYAADTDNSKELQRIEEEQQVIFDEKLKGFMEDVRDEIRKIHKHDEEVPQDESVHN